MREWVLVAPASRRRLLSVDNCKTRRRDASATKSRCVLNIAAAAWMIAELRIVEE